MAPLAPAGVIEVKIVDLVEMRLFVLELMLLQTAMAEANDPFTPRLERAIKRFTEHASPETKGFGPEGNDQAPPPNGLEG
jgi:hypothetical protein